MSAVSWVSVKRGSTVSVSQNVFCDCPLHHASYAPVKAFAVDVKDDRVSLPYCLDHALDVACSLLCKWTCIFFPASIYLASSNLSTCTVSLP